AGCNLLDVIHTRGIELDRVPDPFMLVQHKVGRFRVRFLLLPDRVADGSQRLRLEVAQVSTFIGTFATGSRNGQGHKVRTLAYNPFAWHGSIPKKNRPVSLVTISRSSNFLSEAAQKSS